MVVDFYKRLVTEKAQRNLNYRDLGAVIGKSQDAFRVAVKRKSLTDLEKKAIEKFFGSKQEHHNEIELTTPNRIEDIVAKKIIQDLKPFIEKSAEMRQVNQDALNRSSVLLSMLIDKVEELEERLSSIEKTQSKIYETVSGN